MLFDRFVLVLYVMFNYSWLLLGVFYDSPIRILPLTSLLFSMLSVIIVSLFQLQTIVQQQVGDEDDRWSTISWASVHLCLCTLFLIDTLELANTLAIFLVAGIFITFTTFAVMIMSCKIIANGSNVWIPHVHLTCVCFWILVNYLYASLPINLPFMTFVPVVLMFVLRLYEQNLLIYKCMESLLFFIALVIHISFDLKLITAEHFYLLIVIIISIMTVVSREFKSIFTIFSLPFLLCGLFIYSFFAMLSGQTPTIQQLTEKYNDFVNENDDLIVLPLDGEDIEDNWDEHL
jgi:hypothetical protein